MADGVFILNSCMASSYQMVAGDSMENKLEFRLRIKRQPPLELYDIFSSANRRSCHYSYCHSPQSAQLIRNTAAQGAIKCVTLMEVHIVRSSFLYPELALHTCICHIVPVVRLLRINLVIIIRHCIICYCIMRVL